MRQYQISMNNQVIIRMQSKEDAMVKWKSGDGPFTLTDDNNDVVFKCRQEDINTIEDVTAIIAESARLQKEQAEEALKAQADADMKKKLGVR